ncbi:MAG: hypothetical protein HYX84_01405 [Chloroflexi bacterium]|nr:hypothetical protein [Chloroflexota bacterium]
MLKEDGDKVSMLSGGVPADKVKAKVKAKSKQELEAEKRNKRRAVSRPGPARDILVKVDQGDLAEDGSKNKEDKGRPAVMPGRDKMVQLGRDKAVADKRERLSDNKTPRMTDRTLPKIR